mgnify:CR=1 FL=1
MSAIEAVVFDIGNVLVEWNPRYLYRKVFADEAEMEAFLSGVCTMEWHVEHDRGVSFESNAALLKERHPAHAEFIDIWGSRQIEMNRGPVPGVAALLGHLKEKGVPVHGLTNMPSPIFPALCERFPELCLLEEVVVSGDEGVIKPDPRIFEILIGRASLVPQSTLFIDDSPRNVAAAESLGFRTHRFTDAEALSADLMRHGLI